MIDEELWFKEGLILVIIIPLIRVWWARQFVCWGVDLSGDMFDDEVVFLKVSMPLCCSSV